MNKDNRLFSKSKAKFLPKSADKFLAEEIPQPRKNESAVIFLSGLLINLMFAYLFKYVWMLGSNEAIQQTSKAVYLLYSQGSPLAAINLIHPPIPIFLQLVPVPVLRASNLAAFSGPLLSSLFGAGVLLITNRILLSFRLRDHYRWALLILIEFFPSFLFAAAVGTSDMAYVFMVLIILWGCVLINRKEMAFLICGLGLTLGFFVQYRIVSLLIGVVLASIILKWNMHNHWKEELEGWLLAFITPPLYAIGLWFLLNWLSQNNLFYFINTILDPTQAPAIARHVGAVHPYFLGWDNFIDASAITIVNIWETSFLFLIGSLTSIFFALHFNHRRHIANLMVILSVPAALALMIFLGVLPPWQFVWIALIPLSVVLACQPYQELQPNEQNRMMAVLLILILGSIYINFQALGNQKRSPSEQRFHAIITGDQNREIYLRQTDPYWVFQQDAPIVADALDSFSAEGKILVDGTITAPALIQTEHLQRLIITKNVSIPTIFSQDTSEAKFVLTVSKVGALDSAVFPFAMPELNSEEIPWATKVWESNQTILNWRIFRLNLDKAD